MIIPIKQILTENEFIDQALQNVRAGVGYDDRNGPVGNMTTEQVRPLITNEINALNAKVLSGEIKSNLDYTRESETNSPTIQQGITTAKSYVAQNPNITPQELAFKLADDQRLFDIAQANNAALSNGMVKGGVAGIGAGIGAKYLYDRFKKR